MGIKSLIGLPDSPAPAKNKSKGKKADGSVSKVKTVSCKDCSNFKWMPNTDFDTEYTVRPGISKGKIVFIMSPLEFANLKRKMWKTIICAALQEYSILFLPFPRCVDNVLSQEKIKIAVKRGCKDNFISKKLDEFGPDLVVVFGDTKELLGIDDTVCIDYPGNWAVWKKRRVLLGKDLYSVTKGGFWAENFEHLTNKINRFFAGKLQWQRSNKFSTVTTVEELDAIIPVILQQDIIAVDVETSGLDVMTPDFRLKTIGIAWAGEAVCLGYQVEECVDIRYRERVKDFILDLAAERSITKVCHNLKYEYKVFIQVMGARRFESWEDTMFLSYLFDENRPSNKLKYLAGEFCDGYDSVPDDFANSTFSDLYLYNCLDATYTLRLKLLTFDLSLLGSLEAGTRHLYYDVMLPGCFELAMMELEGVNIDYEYLAKLQVLLQEEVDALNAQIAREYPQTHGKKLTAPKQLADILFSMLKYPVIKSTKTGASVDKEVLVTLAEKHGCVLAKLIMDVRGKEKQLSTYVTPYIEKRADYYGDRVRTSYSQVKAADAGGGEAKGTVTGRLSSANPNLQNIKRGKTIKSMFVPSDKSRLFLQCDLSQAELRIAASYANAVGMLDIYWNDGDIHFKTGLMAAPPRMVEAYNAELDPDKKKKAMKLIRQAAKGINFGLLYGGSPGVLQRISKINYGVELLEDEAVHACNKFFEAYPELTEWHNSTRAFVSKYGMAIAPNGRVRRVPGVFYYQPGSNEYEECHRQALNSIVQGPCSDFLIQIWVTGMKEIRRRKIPAIPRLTVHDSLVLDCLNKDVAAESKDIFVRATQQWTEFHQQYWLKCPMRLDFELGDTWGSLEEGF